MDRVLNKDPDSKHEEILKMYLCFKIIIVLTKPILFRNKIFFIVIKQLKDKYSPGDVQSLIAKSVSKKI